MAKLAYGRQKRARSRRNTSDIRNRPRAWPSTTEHCDDRAATNVHIRLVSVSLWSVLLNYCIDSRFFFQAEASCRKKNKKRMTSSHNEGEQNSVPDRNMATSIGSFNKAKVFCEHLPWRLLRHSPALLLAFIIFPALEYIHEFDLSVDIIRPHPSHYAIATLVYFLIPPCSFRSFSSLISSFNRQHGANKSHPLRSQSSPSTHPVVTHVRSLFRWAVRSFISTTHSCIRLLNCFIGKALRSC